MAETITATVSDITTLSSAEASTPTVETTSLTPSPSETLSETLSIPATSAAPVPVPIPTESSPPTTLETITSASSSSISVVSSETLSDVVSSSSALAPADSSASITSSVSASATDSVSATQMTSGGESTTSTTASATAAPATENPQKTELSTSAIAGIATASVVVVALLLGYLAYLFIVKRKERQRRESQRFSSWFPPQTDDTAGSAPPAVTNLSQGSSLSSPTKRFYAGETVQQKRKSFWRRSFHPPPQDIGVAVAPSVPVSPDRHGDAAGPTATRVSWPSPTRRVVVQQSRAMPEDSRWSVATSFDEDIEAHSQDIPILGSPKARSSARSFSSSGAVEKPAPLRLSRLKQRPETPPSAKLPLTPIYDNGNFEPTIRQVLEDPCVEVQASTVPQITESAALNFSRRRPSLTRTSQDQPGPFTTQMRQQNPAGRFPVKTQANARKQSAVSAQSVSVYTEIEEDDTPEQEEDKQLDIPPIAISTAKRSPLRDLQWPQVPRPAAVAKQSQKVHSPPAGTTIRQVDPSPQAIPATRDQMVKANLSFVKTNTSSSPGIPSETLNSSSSSASPVFPTPPNYGRPNAQAGLARQISNAYKAAARSTTTTTPAPTPTRSSKQFQPEIMSRPGAPPLQSVKTPTPMYQQIQRLSTGRPLAQKLRTQAQGQENMPTRSTSRAKITPMTSRSGDLYLTVGEMEN
ncbi:hypothetical protein OHC33_000323 [Knufia fluminis]|uniref:Uncharacterized protein n=1 Tax=Knufia fluminis TaxID=191047 RepID=A0AAN8EQ42_9EURO|nr:hypothetical protein OHC33_000323 [Knufia fluminis]